MKKLYLTAVLMAAALIALPSIAQANLLSNPGFELPGDQAWKAQDWTSSGEMNRQEWPDFQYFPGSTHGMATWTGTGDAYQEISVIGNQSYTFTIWGKRDSGEVTGTYYMKLVWYGGGAYISENSMAIALIDSWAQYTLTAKAPANADKVRVTFGSNSATKVGKWDEASLTAASEPVLSREVISLNSDDWNSDDWKFEPGNEEKPADFTHFIPVPGLVDLANPPILADQSFESYRDNFGSVDKGRDNFPYDYFWYKRTFTLTPSQEHEHAFIKFNQSRYGTDVWLNGTYLGSYIGCYTSHKYDVTEAIKYDGTENTLLVRLGKKKNLPDGSAVGDDHNEEEFFLPGIWGDVSLILVSNPIIERVQIIPHIDTHTAEARITIKNLETTPENITLYSQVFEKSTGNPASDEIPTDYTILPSPEGTTLIIDIPISNMTDEKLWSPDNPFLYNLVSAVKIAGTEVDTLTTTFGMREFKIDGSNFELNGHRVFLKGSNIAFHRFLTDVELRGDLPWWNEAWIKKVLVDIPKEHNFNFFRNHLGHMYNKWYDIADENGIMIQNEWHFCTTFSASEEQVRIEWTQWLYDNWNHPSIIIWDALNEAWEESGEFSRDIIRDTIIPEMKEIDPTRPWECGFNAFLERIDWYPVDFIEEHPYIYSLGPVITDYWFGHSRSIFDIKNSSEPTVIDECIYFWLKDDGSFGHNRTDIMRRWLGEESTIEQRFEFQAFLAAEVCELFRRIDVDGIAPMVYLSNSQGGTCEWLTGDLENPGLLPIMSALKNAFAPFGVSIELWDRHFLVNETKNINVYVFNDTTESKSGTLRCRIVDENDTVIINVGDYPVTVPGSQTLIQPTSQTLIKDISWVMPSATGTYYLKAELIENSEVVATSKKIAHVLNQPTAPSNLSDTKIMVYDPDNEILDYLVSLGLNAINYDSATLSQQDILILGEGALFDANYPDRISEITGFVVEEGEKHHALMVIEPTYGFGDAPPSERPLLDGQTDLSLSMRTRFDFGFERGYSSYCFPEDPSFSLWNNIDPEHLKMFNGGVGGEIVSHYELELEGTNRQQPLSKSGHNLEKWDVVESIIENGVVVVSRIQIRGRLTEEADPGTDLYSRRVDPVAQQYLLNLLSTYSYRGNWERMYRLFPLNVKEATTSSVEKNEQGEIIEGLTPDKAVDNDLSTRWASEKSDPQWLCLDFEETVKFNRIILRWESAFATAYELQISDDGSSWETIYMEECGDGDIDDIRFKEEITARYVRMYATERINDEWGCSLYEFEVWLIEPKAVASSVQDNDPQYVASKAIDGDITTRWSSNWSDEEWIYIQFNEPKNKPLTFDYIKLYWEAAYGKQYEIQISDDGETWSTIYTETDGNGGIDEIHFDEEKTAEYVRMLGVERETYYGYSLYEFEVYYTKPETKASSMQDFGLRPSYTIDGDTSTRWGSKKEIDPQWIYIDFKIPIDFNRVKLNWEAAYAKEYQIQISDDAVNWTPIHTVTEGNGGIDEKNFDEIITARYVKMYGTKRFPDSQWGYSLWEFEVYSPLSCSIDYFNLRNYDEEFIPVYYIGDTVEYELCLKNLGSQDLTNLTIQTIQEYHESGTGYNKGDPLPGDSTQIWTSQTILKGEELVLTDSYYIPYDTHASLDQTHVIVTQDGVELYDNPEAGIWCPPLSRISGKVTLQGRTIHSESITFELRNTGETTPIQTRSITTDSGGNYTLTGITPGTYDLTAKSPNSLRAKNEAVTVIEGQTTTNIDFSLLEGDCDKNNVVSMMDFSILRATYGTSDPRADFNGNGQVDLTDLSILRSNYGKSGAQ